MLRSSKIICFLIVWLPACFQSPVDENHLEKLFTRTQERNPIISAHRGGDYPGWPENCIATFNYVLDQTPALIECDVRQASDGTLIMMHDETVDRTTNGSGRVDRLTWDYLSGLKLLDRNKQITAYEIPTLRDVLKWAKKNAILTLDIKERSAFELVVKMIAEEDARDHVILITYTIGAAKELYDLDSGIMLSVTIRNREELERLNRSGIPWFRVIAFTGTRLADKDLYKSLHNQQVFCILGTIGNLDRQAISSGDQVYLKYIEKGADIIATDRPIEVAKTLSERWSPETRILNDGR